MRTLAALAVFLAAPSLSLARPDDPPAPRTIRNITVIDVEAGRAIPARTVVIENGKIARIADAASPAPAAGEILDGTGLFLIPGLFDAHVHYGNSPDTYGPLCIAHGVTFVRDMAGDTESIVALRDRFPAQWDPKLGIHVT